MKRQVNFLLNSFDFFYLLSTIIYLLAGEKRFNHRIKDANKRRTAELGQSLQTVAGSEERKNNCFLLWSPTTGKNPSFKMRSVRVQF